MNPSSSASPAAPSGLPRAFTRLAWSNLAAQAAEQVSLAAAPIVAVLALGAGAGVTGLLQTAQTLPFLLLSIPAGVLADRTSRRRLMAGAEAVRVVALAGVLVLLALGRLTWPWLAVLGFVGVCGTVAFTVTAPALVPALVPPAALAAANGRLELARTVAFVAGPALAGALVARTGPAAAFGAAVALSACAAFLLTGLREPARPPRTTSHPLDEVRQGARFVLGHALLRPIFVTQLVFNTAAFVLHAVWVPYAVSRPGLSATGAPPRCARR
jgi:MFS family permease